jgi:hypothetical protein
MTEQLQESPGIPDWLRGADEEEFAELRALGVVNNAPPERDEDRDAFVSSMLRRKHYLDRDLEVLKRAEGMETVAIAARYARLRAPLELRARAIAELLLDLAGRIPFLGKARSRSVGWGTVGLRKAPGRLVIYDEAALMRDAIARAPEHVTFRLECTLAEAHALLIPLALDRGTRVIGVAAAKAALAKVPDLLGVRIEGAGDRPFYSVEAPDVDG